jgi:hypothetical protein
MFSSQIFFRLNTIDDGIVSNDIPSFMFNIE